MVIIKTMADCDYEFIFNKNSFDMNVYNACTIPDVSGGRQSIIEEQLQVMSSILTHTLPNLKVFSSFIDYNDYKYKITVNNI
jgi:hypothetical protein